MMKKTGKLLALVLALVLMTQVFAGCKAKTEETPEPTPETATNEPVQEEKPEEPATEEPEPETVVVTDHAGREVEIPSPSKIEKVYFTSPLGMIFVYTLVPDKLAGAPMQFSEQELKYLHPSVKELKNLGGMQAGSELNREELIASGAQVIFSIGPNKIDETSVSDADTLQEQTNIPVIVVNGSMEEVSASYKLLGEIFGMEEEAKQLSDYCDNVFKNVVEKVKDIPEEDRVAVYYAEQADGLTTEPETSSHAAALKFAGAKNVADVEAKKGSGMSPVSLEQVIAWNPEVIISWGDERGGAYSQILNDPSWANIQAVKDGKVYVMPNAPFSWLDRPPSVNRFLGIQWAANLLYPEVYDVDMVEVAKEFYSLFYHVDLTDEQMNELLVNSVAGAK